MKKLFLSLLALSIFLSQITYALADEYVHGYTKSNGTYVAPYYRSSPDGDPYNNYSYPGNTNPYTGVTAGGNPDTYLNNYYNNSSSGGSGYYPSYTATTPTCPSMSSYNSLTGSCTCLSGYIVQNGSCELAYLACTQQIGLMSTYNSLTNTCDCMSGYVLKNGECTYGNTACEGQLGYHSSYDILSKMCECDYGYYIDTSGQCVSKTSSYVPTYIPTPPTCGLNASAVSGQCQCNTGYTVGPNKTDCISYNQNCQNQYGPNSYGDQNYCYCSTGYQFNSDKTSCQLSTPSLATPPITNSGNVKGASTYKFTRSLKLGMSGDDVQALQSMLSDKGFLNWSVNTKIGYFGATTKAALIKYQKSVNIRGSGILDASTIKSLSNG